MISQVYHRVFYRVKYFKYSVYANTEWKTDTGETHTLKELAFHFLSNWMGYDRGDSFPFDFEPNGIPIRLKLKGKL